MLVNNKSKKCRGGCNFPAFFTSYNVETHFAMSNSDALTARFLQEIEENSGLIYKVCYMYAEDSEHLKDLYQEVVANLWQGYSGFKGDAKISTWIYRIALNTCVSYIRRKSRQGSQVPLDDMSAGIIDESHERAMCLKMMYEMISTLGRIDKAIIMLWLDEYSYEEIAHLTGISRNNVASRIHRIKQRFSAE